MFSESDVKMFDFFLTTYLICSVDVQSKFLRMITTVPLLADMHGPFIVQVRFHAEASQEKNEKNIAVTFSDIDDVLQLFNIAKFCDYVDHMISLEFEIKYPQIQLGLFHTLTYT